MGKCHGPFWSAPKREVVRTIAGTISPIENRDADLHARPTKRQKDD